MNVGVAMLAVAYMVEKFNNSIIKFTIALAGQTESLNRMIVSVHCACFPCIPFTLAVIISTDLR